MSTNRTALSHDGDGRVLLSWNAHEPSNGQPSPALAAARAKLKAYIDDPANAYQVVLEPGTVALAVRCPHKHYSAAPPPPPRARAAAAAPTPTHCPASQCLVALNSVSSSNLPQARKMGWWRRASFAEGHMQSDDLTNAIRVNTCTGQLADPAWPSSCAGHNAKRQQCRRERPGPASPLEGLVLSVRPAVTSHL